MTQKTNEFHRVLSAAIRSAFFLLSVFSILLAPVTLKAQTGGEGAITGTVQDSTGAVVVDAIVVARNVDTGVETTRVTSSSGVYEVSPLIVGTYSVTVTAKGFEGFKQEKVVINENQIFGLNAVMKLGSGTETVTVTDAPPQLDTANATLGGTISSQEFLDLPLMVAGNQQRDITSFSNLLPGAQVGSRSSLFSGTANRVQEVYLDGVPLTTISQIGDNRPIFNLVPAEGIGQVGALTSGAGVEYQGAGSVNYNMKSGGNAYHGSVADFVRNTIFDTWGFTAIAATQKKLVNGVVTTVPVGKPIDHQNEFTASFGGPVRIPHVFDGRDKLFFFAAYDKVHTRSAPVYATTTIPTTLMQAGDFTELNTVSPGVTAPPGYSIFDPTTQSCAGSTCTRSAFTGIKNGQPNGNVIPASEISPIAKAMQQFLPTPTTLGIQNNYLGGIPSGYDNWLYSGRIDYTVSSKQTISATVTGGNRHAVPYTSTALVLPLPYLGTTASTVAGHWADFSDSYTIKPNLVNQFKFGFSNFGGPPLKNITQGIPQYEAGTSTGLGINFAGVPSDGQAVTEFPTNIFGGSNGQAEWGEAGSGVTATTVSENYTAVDNLLWIKGKHAMTFGVQEQRLEENASNYDGPTSSLTLNWSVNETAQEGIINGNEAYLPNTGYSYASFLMGAVNNTGITLQPFSVLGGRFRTVAPYFEDDYKATSKLTLNLGVRWDYIPTYQEALGRFSFLNPTLANPVTGNPGALEFAANWGGSSVSCGCSTPAQNYMKNWGPHVGFAYSVDDKTVFRGAFSTLYSHSGGTGGSGVGTFSGTSQLGFTSSPAYNAGAAGTGAGPTFYLNNSGYNAFLKNSNFGGPNISVPGITPPGPISQTLNVGNTVTSAGAFVAAGVAPGYPDPYLSGRAPEFNFWNFGMERQITKDLSIVLNYAGDQSHFITGSANMRGLQSGQINPIWYVLGTTLNQAATPANLAAANLKGAALGLPAINLPYTNFGVAAGTSAGSGKATIGQALTWMPQFAGANNANGTVDTWGNQSANANYNSFQLSLVKRESHGLQFNLNYTYSHNIDDAGTQRSGYPIPGTALINGQSWKANRIDRSLSANSVPENLAIFGVYRLPFGKNHMGADNFIVRNIAGGWSLSGIFTYVSGTPILVTASSCTSTFQPTAGTCMPDLNPAFTKQTIRQNGSWGKGATATNLGGVTYANGYIGNTTLGDGGNGNATNNAVPCGSASITAFCNPGQFMFGDGPRTAAFGLRNPSVYNLNASIRRSFNITPERVKFIFGVDCQNVTNKVTFGGINASVDSTTFGQVTTATNNGGSRDFQFSGRLNF